MGDYPVIPDSDNPYSEGVATFYKEAYAYALAKKQPGQAIIAMDIMIRCLEIQRMQWVF